MTTSISNIRENSCTITMIYLGPRIIKSNGPYQFKIHADEILILQTHTQTGTSCVFKGSLKPNAKFNFKSHRLTDCPLILDIYINGIIDQHVFACCEKGFVHQCHVQSKRYSCQLQSITGGIPCQKCQYHDLMNFYSHQTQPEEFDETDFLNYQLPMSTLPSNMINEQIVIKDTPSSQPVSKFVTTEKDNNDNKQTAVFETNSVNYKPAKDSEQTEESLDAKKAKNVNNSQSQKNQSINNVETTDSTSTNNFDSNNAQKIMNENSKTNIPPVVANHMQALLTRYLKAVLKQTKSNDTTNNDEENKTTITSKESNRDANAKIDYTPSSISTSVSSINSKAESFVLIWLDRYIQKHHDAVESEQNLRAIVNSLITCKTIDETNDIINQIQNQQIYLIVSGELGERLLSMNEIVECSKLNSIYIFCRDQNKHTYLLQRSDKVCGIYIDIQSLCDRLKNDTKQAIENLLSISTASDTTDDKKDQIRFICSQLHRDLLFTMEYNNNAMSDLLNYCSKAYEDNSIELGHMKKLKKDYHAGNAIRWYTENTFLYKMLNKAFLDREISTLYKFQFYIKDLHMQLEQMHSLYKPSLKSQVFTVYRGLNMPLEEFEKKIRAEKKNLIAFDSFLSTTLDKNVAKAFALKKQNPNNQSILFSIEIDANRMERPFADISRRSVFKNEREILFSIGTVFRIDDVAEEKTSEDLWIVRLSTVDEKDEQLQAQTQKIQEVLLEFFQTILDITQTTSDHQRIAASHANLGSMYYKQGNFEKSLTCYNEALRYLLQCDSPDAWTKAIYIDNVAKAHLALKHTDQALSFYEKALEIHRQRECQPNDSSLINTLHKIGDIYRTKQQWNHALEQYRSALDLQLSSLKSDQFADSAPIATSYICIGNVYVEQGDYLKALEAFQQALHQQKEHLPEPEPKQHQHPVLAFLYNNIGAMHYRLGNYEQTLENQLKCLEIESKSLPKQHRTFAATYENISRTYAKLLQFDEAIKYSEKCVEQLEHHQMENNPQLDAARQRLKQLQLYKKLADEATV